MAHYKALVDRAARAIGKVCISWGHLESVVDEFIACLSLTKEDKVQEIVIGNMDIKTKLLVAKGLAVLRNFDKQWTAECVKLLDQIDNSLRPQRNNIVHSAWYVPKGRLTRTMRKTRLKRPQSFQLALETMESVAIPPSKIMKVVAKIEHAHFELFLLFCYAMDWDEIEGKELRELSWPQYLRGLKSIHPTKRKQKKPSSQRQSSQG